jgi:hypothetical protein
VIPCGHRFTYDSIPMILLSGGGDVTDTPSTPSLGLIFAGRLSPCAKRPTWKRYEDNHAHEWEDHPDDETH